MYAVRERCGRQLAAEANVEADIVSTVPDSATPAALGYSQQVSIGFVFSCLLTSILSSVLRLHPVHCFAVQTVLVSQLTSVHL